MRLADRLHAPAFVYSLVIFHLLKAAENKEEKENQRRWNRNSLHEMLGATGSRDKAGDNNGEDGWTLDEEAVASTTGEAFTPSDKSIRSSEHWWQITSSYDPALDAEPALWDGERLVGSESSNIFDEYLLIQDTWEEHKVS
ncbi:uncharacterized protein LOC134775449 [Penaeus indicus]|uniref:uncharacterized protein LOC134775449 n=1 Tax=Penaeus indicus TaxID=29960 RepID=UPI00300D598E